MAIRDHIVVNERVLMIQQLKQQPSQKPTAEPTSTSGEPPLL